MSESFRALCSDFYINQKLSLKLDLPKERQSILDLFDRLRKQYPGMTQFRRVKDEIALESDPAADPSSAHHRWVAVKTSNIRSGSVNAPTMEEAYALHRHVLEITPYFLSISPLDVDFLELLFGFDLSSDRNHDEAVADALIAGTPLEQLLSVPGATIVDCQPAIGLVMREAIEAEGLSKNRDVEVTYEIKTRPGARQAAREEPISVYLTLRHYGPVEDIRMLPAVMGELARLGEELAQSRVLPGLVSPLRGTLGS